MTKPRVFIASSTEGLAIARAIRQSINKVAVGVVWNELVPRGLSHTVFEVLLKAVNTFDFGIFVFYPDDVTEKRNKRFRSTRDNVVLELGLFAGRLGRQRAFIVSPEGTEDLTFPSDLLGHIPAVFSLEETEKDVRAALKLPGRYIGEQIKTLGKIDRSEELLFAGTGLKFGVSHFESKKLGGLWLSRFEYRAFRGNTFLNKFQFDMEYLQATASDALTGENIAFCAGTKDNYHHQIGVRLYKGFVAGVWQNDNTENVGCFQLNVHSNLLIMTGQHLGNANNNSIQAGDWKWVKITGSEAFSKSEIAAIKQNGTLREAKKLEKIFNEALKNGVSIALSEVQDQEV